MAAPNRRASTATLERPEPGSGAIDPALARLARSYTFRDPVEVEAFLRANPELIPLLVEAAGIVPRYFGEDSALALEVFVDPEGHPEHKDLYALVGVAGSVSEKQSRLRRFDHEWWLDRAPSSPGVLVFDVE